MIKNNLNNYFELFIKYYSTQYFIINDYLKNTNKNTKKYNYITKKYNYITKEYNYNITKKYNYITKELQ